MQKRQIMVLTAIACAVTALGATCVQASVYSDDVQALAPQLYWRLDESSKSGGTAADTTGNHPGAYPGSGVTNTAGPTAPLNNAALFDGTNAAGITFPDGNGTATSLPAGNADRTLILWAKTTSSNVNLLSLGSAGDAVAGTGFHRLVDFYINGNGQFDASNFGGPDPLTGSVTDGAWHMFALTITATTPGNANWQLYEDGAASGSSSPATDTVLGSYATLGGGITFNGGSIAPAIGSLDEFAVFNKVLTADQINGLYAAASQTPEPATAMLAAVASLALLARRRSRA